MHREWVIPRDPEVEQLIQNFDRLVIVVGLPWRALRTLERMGLDQTMVGEIAKKKRADFLAVPGCGPATATMIEVWVSASIPRRPMKGRFSQETMNG